MPPRDQMGEAEEEEEAEELEDGVDAVSRAEYAVCKPVIHARIPAATSVDDDAEDAADLLRLPTPPSSLETPAASGSMEPAQGLGPSREAI